MPNNWPRQLIRSFGFSIFWSPVQTEDYGVWWPAWIAVIEHSLIFKAALSVVIVTLILFFLARIPAINKDDKNT
jgi:hypothetical protein